MSSGRGSATADCSRRYASFALVLALALHAFGCGGEANLPPIDIQLSAGGFDVSRIDGVRVELRFASPLPFPPSRETTTVGDLRVTLTLGDADGDGLPEYRMEFPGNPFQAGVFRFPVSAAPGATAPFVVFAWVLDSATGQPLASGCATRDGAGEPFAFGPAGRRIEVVLSPNASGPCEPTTPTEDGGTRHDGGVAIADGGMDAGAADGGVAAADGGPNDAGPPDGGASEDGGGASQDGGMVDADGGPTQDDGGTDAGTLQDGGDSDGGAAADGGAPDGGGVDGGSDGGAFDGGAQDGGVDLPPTFAGGVSATAFSTTQITLSWTNATDDITPPDQIVYLICVSQIPHLRGGCTPFAATLTTTAGSTLWNVGGLAPGTRYYFIVRAQDGAGNTDSNAVELSARTMGSGAAASVAAGLGLHSCSLLADGTVRCWGVNAHLQLGGYVGAQSTTPVAVTGVSGARAVVVGQDHSCALLANGTAECWGRNYLGQLGDGRSAGDGELDELPVQVSGLTNAVALAAGEAHTCALGADGKARCWGYNFNGQLGNLGSGSTTLPVEVSGLSNVTHIATGSEHTCALLSDGTVRCWGQNLSGELGDGTMTSPRYTPVAPAIPGGVVAITAGWAHSCALGADGKAYCWGDNFGGQLGDATTFTRLAPVPVVGTASGPPMANFVSIAAGAEHTCAVKADGTAYCWGYNASSQLGDGTTFASSTPRQVPSLAGTVSIAAGQNHSCALLAGGEVRCWGEGAVGELGQGSTANSVTPVTTSGLEAVVGGTRIAPGDAHTCALLTDGTVECWGDNVHGQLGDGTTAQRAVPAPASGLTGAIALATGAAHSCALVSDRTVRCWGDNVNGQLGVGVVGDRPTPTPVSNLQNVLAIAAGAQHTCALLSDGSLRCWGDNNYEQLGNAVPMDQLTPVAVPSVSSAVGVVAGGRHTCALLVDGTARCWGDGTLGQLGDGSSAQRSSPASVSGLPVGSLRALAAGQSHTCGVRFDGTLSCWGDNASGQIGDSTTMRALLPVSVTGLANQSLIAAGGAHTCSRQGSGELTCWGLNASGQLGNGTTSTSALPVPVDPSLRPANLALGTAHTCALLADGTARCWGQNSFGEIGDGTTSERHTPSPLPFFP
jgi:alpha-tubulin suppressor-like RCC1 family protein